MLIERLQYFQTSILQNLDRFCEYKHWRLATVMCLALIAIIFAFPAYDTLLKMDHVDNLVYLKDQFEHPFESPDASPESHQAKRVFRLSVPIIANITGVHNPVVYLILQHFLGLGFFFLGLRLAERLLQNKTSALLLLLSIAGIYLGKSFFWDLQGWFDGIAFFFLLLAMINQNPLVQWLSLSIAFWTDERAILASGLIWFWWKLKSYGIENLSLGKFLKPDIVTITFILAWGLYLGIRLWLADTYGMQVPMDESGAIGFQRWEMFIPALFTSLEGIWLLFIPLLLLLHQKGNIWQFLGLGLAFTVVIIPALMVADMTRSITYAFPIIFIAVYFLHQSTQAQEQKQFLLVVALGCLCFPNLTVISHLSWLHPIFPGIFVNH